jgi:hypothetical protein
MLALSLVVASTASASVGGLQPGVSGVPGRGGAPGEMNCTACHASYPVNPDAQGRVELGGAPPRYAPGARYTLTLTVSHPDPAVRRWGFQVTAVAAETLAGAGQLVATDARTTQVVRGTAGGRLYVEHGYHGTGAGTAGRFSWSFDWVAPSPGVGDVAFYGCANAANLDGANSGDRIYCGGPLAVVHGPEA